jgi:integrase
MASLRKFPNSKFWYACFTMPNRKRAQRSTGETSRKLAQAKADSWESLSQDHLTARKAQKVIADIYRAQSGLTLESSTPRSFFISWLARRKGETSPATYTAYSSRLDHFLNFLGEAADAPLPRVSSAAILKYRDALATRVATRTTNMALKVLRMALEDARRDHLIPDNPAKDVRTLRVDDATERRAFTLPELTAILSVCDPEWKSLVLFGIYSGQRLSDLCRLTWNNIDLEAEEIRLKTGKTGRQIIIPLAAPLLRHVRDVLPVADKSSTPLHPRAAEVVKTSGKVSVLSKQFSEILIQAGLEQADKPQGDKEKRGSRRQLSIISFHALRHTATSLMKNAGISPAIVQDIIGHSSSAVSASYTHVEGAAKRKALDSIPDLSAQPHTSTPLPS